MAPKEEAEGELCAAKAGRGWRRGVDVKLVGGLKERGGNVSA